jgi:hypothetical protein
MPKTETETSAPAAAPTQMIAAYFVESATYFSASKGEFLQVSAMNQAHAANAAAKLLADSYRWSLEAGVTTRNPDAWMIRQPLFLALVQRAHTID